MKIKKNREQHKARNLESLAAKQRPAGRMRHKNDRRAKDARRDETRRETARPGVASLAPRAAPVSHPPAMGSANMYQGVGLAAPPPAS